MSEADPEPPPALPTATPLDGTARPGRRPDLVLLPGMLGDVTIFETDLFSVDPGDLATTRVDYSVTAGEVAYDLMLEDDGRAFYAVLGSNFVNGTLDVCREMLLEPHTVTGLSDAGAHVNLISDCSASTWPPSVRRPPTSSPTSAPTAPGSGA